MWNAAKVVAETVAVVDGVVEGAKAVGVALDCVNQCEAQAVARDPYYQNMPTSDAVEATYYASQTGEVNDSSSGSGGCLIA